MVLTAAQSTAFFTGANSMAIPQATYAQLAQEGIVSPTDLVDFDKDTIEQVAKNLRNPSDRIPNPDPNAAAGSTIPRPPYTFGAKSQKRLLEACDYVRYCETTGRALTAGNTSYPIIRYFAEQWKALTDRKKDDPPEVPKISKTLPVLKWSESFDDYLSRAIGNRTIPLSYIIRDVVVVPAAAPPLANNRPYSELHGSVEGELIARASHDHALYSDDNGLVYYALEVATRSTSYAASIKPFQRAKDGRGAYFAIRAQYAGRDKWEAEIKRQDNLLHTRIWKGQGNFSLERFIGQHRNAFVSMTQCAQHIEFQLPNEYTRVGYLLDAIQSGDAGLQAAMAQVRSDDADANGKRHNFEAAAAYLLPYDPVAKKRSEANKRGHEDAQVGDATADVSAAAGFGTKAGIGKTGVHLRFYEEKEYKKLPKDQRDELRQWREEQRKKGVTFGKKDKKDGKPDRGSSTMTRKEVSALLSKEFEKFSQKLTKQDEEADEIDALISSLGVDKVEESPKKKVRVQEPQSVVNTSALKTILKRVKNPYKN